MSDNLEQFKSFVKQHPGLNELVLNKSRTWQNIYEDWVFYKDDNKWNKYTDKDVKLESQLNSVPSNFEEATASETSSFKIPTNMEDMMKQALTYVKKINPDSITKTVGNAQKILALISGLGLGSTAGIAKSSKTGDPLFDKRFDEWY